MAVTIFLVRMAQPFARTNTGIDALVATRHMRRLASVGWAPVVELTLAPILGIVTIQRMDNVAIVVNDLDGAVAFFTELGMELEGRMPIEGRWAGKVVGLGDLRSEIAMMRIP